MFFPRFFPSSSYAHEKSSLVTIQHLAWEKIGKTIFTKILNFHRSICLHLRFLEEIPQEDLYTFEILEGQGT